MRRDRRTTKATAPAEKVEDNFSILVDGFFSFGEFTSSKQTN
jgi:hypothetical protein